MTYTGQVKGGVVVFDGPVPLAEGTAVRVEATAAPAPKTLAERYAAVIGTAPNLPPDMAENHDHYVHGTPKR